MQENLGKVYKKRLILRLIYKKSKFRRGVNQNITIFLNHEARKKAKQLLEEAKRKVEELIEKN
jgi:hypothetical protein